MPFSTTLVDYFNKHFCGCGTPRVAGQVLLKILECFDGAGLDPKDEPRLLHTDGRERLQALLGGDDDLLLLFLYVLEGQDLTEHGSSIYGSWLTSLGAEVRTHLRTHGAQPVFDTDADDPDQVASGLSSFAPVSNPVSETPHE
jgi:hypothetical protein